MTEVTQPDTKLHVYEVTVNDGFKTKIQLTAAEARKRKLIPERDEQPTVQTKAKTSKTTKQEGDA